MLTVNDERNVMDADAMRQFKNNQMNAMKKKKKQRNDWSECVAFCCDKIPRILKRSLGASKKPIQTIEDTKIC